MRTVTEALRERLSGLKYAECFINDPSVRLAVRDATTGRSTSIDRENFLRMFVGLPKMVSHEMEYMYPARKPTASQYVHKSNRAWLDEHGLNINEVIEWCKEYLPLDE